MELKLNTQAIISSSLYVRLLELWTYNKLTKKKLLSKVPSEKDLDMYVYSIKHYGDIRQAYIEFCNECDIDVDLHFEESEPQEPDTQESETSYNLTSVTQGIYRSCYVDDEVEEDVPFQEDEE